jgi:hypothetical protein
MRKRSFNPHPGVKPPLKLIVIVLSLIIFCAAAQGQSRGLGVGLILGEPTGISMKYWSGRTNAFDFAFAWSLQHSGWIYIHSDYLWHAFNVINVSRGALPIYYGVGGALGLNDETSLGVRGVAGLNYLFSGVPLDAFLELVPLLFLAPKTEVEFHGAIGIRYFF